MDNMASDAPNYNHPAPSTTATRSRGSSTPPKYIPDGYQQRPTPMPDQHDYLKPGFSHPHPTPQNQELQVYTPPVPEQYETPGPRAGVPAAAHQELQPHYFPEVPSRRVSDAHERLPPPAGVSRHNSSASSHHSGNSHRSYYSARSRRSYSVGQTHLDMEHERQQRERARSTQRDHTPSRLRHESRPPSQPRKRSRAQSHALPYREPHRAFGSSLFSFFGGIKGALKD